MYFFKLNLKKYIMKRILILLFLIFISNFAYCYEFRPLISPEAFTQQESIKENYPKIDEVEQKIFNQTFNNDDVSKRLDRIELSLFKKKYIHRSLSQRLDNVLGYMAENEQFSGISTNELSMIEKRIFNRIYNKDDILTRITRLEKEKQASLHYNSFAAQNPLGTFNSNNYSTTNQNGGVKNFFKNMFNSFGTGIMTGYTPPVYDQYSYNPYRYYPQNPYYNNYNYGGLNPLATPAFQQQFISPDGFYNNNYSNFSGTKVNIL